MATQWLRLWHDMPNDPKWRTIAKASKQSITAVIAIYIHLLVNASNATERGRTQNVCSEDLASALDLECDQVDAIIDAMQGRVLDGELITGWSKRQVEREDGAAERAKAWREAQKANKQTQPNATERKETPDKDTDTDKSKPKTLTASPSGFAEFWAAYPKKKSNGVAEKAWKRIKPDLQTVLSAIERAKTSADWLKEQGQFIPHPASWLNAKGWEDELTPASASITSCGKPWFLSAAGISQHAAQIGIEQAENELFPIFKQRVYNQAGVTDEMVHQAQAEFRV